MDSTTAQTHAGAGKPIRLLIADDSMFMRMAIISMCELNPEIEIVGEAENGAEAVDMARALQPDVITMDLDMPTLDGISATGRIRETQQTPILVLSGLSERGSEMTFRALQAGASDFLCKSNSALDIDLGTIAEEVVEKIVFWGRQRPAAPASVAAVSDQAKGHDIVIITAGSGGPPAVMELVAGMAPPSCPVLIAIDLAQPLIKPMIEFLSAQLAFPVRAAADAMPLAPGEIVVAPMPARCRLEGNAKGLTLHLADRTAATEQAGGLLGSAAGLPLRVLTLVLTGDDEDATGASLLAKAGQSILAQTPESCAAAKATRAVLAAGAATAARSLAELAAALRGA